MVGQQRCVAAIGEAQPEAGTEEGAAAQLQNERGRLAKHGGMHHRRGDQSVFTCQYENVEPAEGLAYARVACAAHRAGAVE